MSFYLRLLQRCNDPEDPCISWLDGESRAALDLSYGALQQRVGRAAHWLRERGLEPGDVLALQLQKSPLFLEMHLAALGQGIVTLPLNPGYSAREVAFFLSDSKARLAICSTAEPIGNTEVIAAESVDTRACVPRPPEPSVSREDAAVILYTSGTTGRPKGAVIQHGNIQAAVEALHSAWRWSRDDILLHTLPLFHVHGLFVAQFGALWAGARTISLPRFEPGAWLDGIEAWRATVVMGVPTHYNRLLAAPRTSHDLTSLRLVTSGSAPLPAAVHQAFEARFGHRILERYGMTEIGIVLSNPYEGERRPGTVGFPLPGVRARICDPDSGTELPTKTVGEIRIAGPSVFSGYLGLPEQTARTLQGGWMKTGDLGLIDEDGYFHVVGRSKDMVISGGLNVYPREIESVLLAHPAVAEAAVVGAPDPDFGERVVASIVARAPAEPSDLVAWCRQRLAAFKVPKAIEFLDELPRNAMGKVQKQHLRETWRTPRVRGLTSADEPFVDSCIPVFRAETLHVIRPQTRTAHYFVAEIGSGPVGYLRLDPQPTGTWWAVSEVFVLPSVRRIGVARALWTAALEAARVQEADGLEWLVTPGDELAAAVGKRLVAAPFSRVRAT